MISRIWHGYTTFDNADRNQAVATGGVIAGLLPTDIPGFEKIELLRRDRDRDVEFITVMWFHDFAAIRAFIGENDTRSHVSPQARAVLSRFDKHARHCDLLLTKVAGQ